jgi:hypothetical protein
VVTYSRPGHIDRYQDTLLGQKGGAR